MLITYHNQGITTYLYFTLSLFQFLLFHTDYKILTYAVGFPGNSVVLKHGCWNFVVKLKRLIITSLKPRFPTISLTLFHWLYFVHFGAHKQESNSSSHFEVVLDSNSKHLRTTCLYDSDNLVTKGRNAVGNTDS